jgi:hypothetical protein
MSNKTFTYEYEILPKHLKHVIGENRCNLIKLYETFPTVKFSKLWNPKTGFYIETSSLNILENVKRELYKLVINAENITNQNAIRKHTIKERYTRQHQFEAAEKLRKAFELESTAESSLNTTEILEREVIVTDENIAKIIKNNIDHKNPFALLDDACE